MEGMTMTKEEQDLKLQSLERKIDKMMEILEANLFVVDLEKTPAQIAEEKRIDPIIALLEAMSKLGPGEHYWMQFTTVPIGDADKEWKEEGQKIINKIAGRPEKKETTFFERTDKLQIENYNGRIDTASVRWVNDYELIIQKLHPRNMEERKAISIRILSTKGKTYTFEYSFVGESKKQIGTVTKTN